MSEKDAEDEIVACIAYYSARGRSWLSPVCFIAMKAVGFWPLPTWRKR